MRGPQEASGTVRLKLNALTEDPVQLLAAALWIAQEHAVEPIEHRQLALAHVRHDDRESVSDF